MRFLGGGLTGLSGRKKGSQLTVQDSRVMVSDGGVDIGACGGTGEEGAKLAGGDNFVVHVLLTLKVDCFAL